MLSSIKHRNNKQKYYLLNYLSLLIPDFFYRNKLRNKLIEDECECDKKLREIIYYSTWISVIVYIFFTGISFGLLLGAPLGKLINEEYEQIGKNYKLATQRLQEELNKRKK